MLCHVQGRDADHAVSHARMAQSGPTQQNRRQRQPGPLPSRILWLKWQQPLQVRQGYYMHETSHSLEIDMYGSRFSVSWLSAALICSS